MRFRALLLLAIAAGVHAGPLSFEETQCATTCVPSTKFGYETGITYRFEYSADTITAYDGTVDEHSALHMHTTASIHVLSPCELVLSLSDTRLEEYAPTGELIPESRRVSSRSAGFRSALEAQSLRFSFQDGRVADVCASNRDDVWVVNAKRGILSALQNSMSDLHADDTVTETDVNGECQAEYKVESLGFNTVSLSKRKNLLGCTKRNDYFTSLQATSYLVPSAVQSLPLLRSSHECSQKINNGIMVHSECTEQHVFRPFSEQDSGASTTTTTLLSYLGASEDAQQQTGATRRTSLHFEHESRASGDSSDISRVADVLKEICESEDIRPQTPQLFSKLVYAMRHMDVNALSRLHRKVEAGRICSNNADIATKFFHDAIPATGTEASVALIRELTASNEIAGEEAEMWISSLAFLPNPTLEILQQAKTLLTTPSRQTYLSVSSLVHSYCSVNPDCVQTSTVQDIVNIFTENLGYNCRVNSESEMEQMIMSLKALGNSGASARASSTLARCVVSRDSRVEIRLAAIEAYRRLSCEENRDELIRVMSDVSDDVEVRITAYLAVMQCPTAEVIRIVKQTLASEPVNQVGSFMWTHLTNLMETADPFKQDIRAVLEDEKLAKEFNLDNRKFSRNYEGSAFFDSINVGAKYESNLIWSPESFMPRSAMLNLTVDMFGKSVNLLEVGARAEGLERYLEMMFGPNGYFPNKAVNDAINNRLSSLEQNLKNKLQSDPRASAYLKIFGNELQFWETDFSNDENSFNVLDFFIKLAQEHQAEITRTMMFLDSEMTVPTVAGFPLKLAVNGTAAINVKVGGQMDLRRVAVWPSSLLIDGYLKPSAAVTVSMTMGVNLQAARTGLKTISTMHTSTEMSGKLELQESQILSASFNVPEQKQEIINVESKLFVVNGDEEHEQALSDRSEEVICTGDRMSKITGMRLCTSHSMPADRFVTRSAFPSGSLTLEKVDTHSSIDFEMRFETQKERRNNNWAYTNVARVYFDTPGSGINRLLMADFTLDQEDKKFSANLATPWKEASVNGALNDRPDLIGANFAVSVDREQVMDITAQVGTESQGDAMRFRPLVTIATPWLRTMTLSGMGKYSPGPNIECDITIDAFQTPITYSSSVQLQGSRYEIEQKFRSPFFNNHGSGFLTLKENLLSTRMQHTYDYGNSESHNFVFNGKIKDSSTRNAVKYSLSTAVQTSEMPEYNFELDTDTMVNPRHMENNIALKYGADASDENKVITMTYSANKKGDLESNDIELDLDWALTWRAMGIDMRSKLIHGHSLYNDLTTQVMFSHTPGHEVNIGTAVHMSSIEPLQVSGDLTLSYPGREMRLYKIVEEETPSHYNTRTIIQWQTGQQIRVQSVYKIEDLRHSLDSEITLPSSNVVAVSSSVNLDAYDFALTSSLNMNEQTYSTALSYVINQRRMEATGNFDLSLPRRHITIETSGTARVGDYAATIATYWDADRDTSKKLIVNSKLEIIEDGKHNGQMKVIYPGRKITLSFNQELNENDFTHHSELAWTTKKSVKVDIKSSRQVIEDGSKVENSMEITTPFFNNIKLESNYESMSNKLSGHISADYGKVISADVTIENTVESTTSEVLLHTPFRTWERLSVSTSHSLSKPLKELHFIAARNERKVEVDVQGILEVSNTALEISIKTPMSENIILNTAHTFEENKIQAELQASYGQRQVTSVLDMQLDGLLSNHGQFNLNTPYRTVSQIELTWRNLFNKVTDFEINHDIKVNNNRLSYEIAHKQNDLGLETSLRVESSSQILRRLDIVTKSTFDSETLNLESTITLNEVQHALLTVNAESNGIDCEARVQLQSSLPMARDVSLNMFKKGSQSPNVGRMELQWAPSKIIALDYEGIQDYNTIQGEWRLTTPFRQLQRVVFNVDHSRSYEHWQTRSSLEYAPTKRISLNAQYNIADSIAASIEIETPCPYIQSFRAAVEQSSRDEFLHKSSIAYLMANYPEMTYTGQLSAKAGSHVNGVIEVSTPCPYLRRQRISINTEMEGESLTSKIEATIYPHHEITVEANYTNGVDRFEVSGNLASTFAVMPSLSVGLKHEGSGVMFIGSGHIESRLGNFPVTYNHGYTMQGFRKLNGNTRLQSPVMEELLFNVNHEMNGDTINCNAVGQLGPNKKITIESMINTANGLTMTSELNTPFPKLRKIEVNVKHDGTTLDYFTCISEFNVYSVLGEYSMSSNVRVNGYERMTGTVNLNDIATITANRNVNYNDESASAAVSWGRKSVQIMFENKFDENKRSITFSSPFRGFEEIQYTDIISISPAGHNVNMNLRYAAKKEIDLEMKLSTARDIMASMKLQTPFKILSNAALEITHSGECTDFTTLVKVEGTINKVMKSIESNVEVKLGRESSAVLRVTSNIPGHERYALNSNFNLIGQRSYQGSLRMSCPRIEFQLTSHLNTEVVENISGGVELTGPIEMAVALTHVGELEHFEQSLEVSFNGKRGRYDGSFDSNPVNGLFSLQTPFSRWARQEVRFSGEGTSTYNTINLEMKKDDQVMLNVNHRASLGEGLSYLLTVETPVSDKLELSIDHQGNHEFTHTSYLRYGGSSLLVVSGSLHASPLNGELAITTPLKLARSTKLSIKSSGNMKNFESEIAFEINRHKTVLKTELDNRDAFTGKAAITSTYSKLNGVSLDYSHTLTQNSFDNEMTLAYGSKSIMLASGVKQNPYEAYVRYESACPVIRNIDISMSFAGVMSRFVSSVNATINDMQLHANMDLDATSDVIGNLNVDFPFMPKVTGKLSHSMSQENIQSMLDIRYGSKAITATADVNTSPIKGSLTFNSPCPYLRDMDIKFAHEERNGQYDTEIVFKHDRIGRSVYSQTLQTSPVRLVAEMTTPCKHFQNVKVELNHVGDVNNFENNLKITRDRQVVSYTGQFNQSYGKFVVDASALRINTLFGIEFGQEMEIVQPVRLSAFGKLMVDNDWDTFSYDLFVSQQPFEFSLTTVMFGEPPLTFKGKDRGTGDITSFDALFQLERNGEDYINLRTQFDASALSAHVQFDSEWTSTAELFYTHTGTMEQFECNAVLKYEDNELFSGNLHFEKEPMILRTRISTAYALLRSNLAEVTFSGSLANFQSTAKMMHNGVQLFETDLTFSMTSSSLSIDLNQFNFGKIKCPETSLRMSFEGDESAFTSSFSITCMSKTIGANLRFDNEPFTIDLTAVTPMRGYENMALSYNHQGDWNQFNAQAELAYRRGKTIEATLLFENSNKLVTSLRSPFGDGSLSGQYSNDGTRSVGTMNLKAGQREFNVNTDIRFTSSPTITIEMNTPFQGWQEIRLTHNHNLYSGSLQSSSSAMANGRLISVNFEGRYYDVTDMQGHLTVETPFRRYERFEVSAKHRQEYSHMQTDLSVMFSPENVIEGTFKLNTVRGIETQLLTNVRGFEDIACEIIFEGELSKFKTAAVTRLSPNQEIKAEVEFELSDQLVASSATFRSPMRGYESLSASLHLDGSWSRFEGNAEFNWGDRQIIALSTSGSLPSSMTVTVNNVVLGYSATFDGERKGNVIISLPKRQQIELVFDGILRGDVYDFETAGTIEIKTPFSLMRTGKTSFTHSHSSAGIINNLLLQYNALTILEHQISANSQMGHFEMNRPMRVLATYTVEGDRIRFSLERPIVGTFDVYYGNSVVGLSMAQPVPIDVKASISENQVGFEMKQPYPVEFSISAQGRAASVKIEQPFEFEASFDFDNVKGQVDMKYPYDLSANYQLGMGRGEMKMRGIYDFDAVYDMNSNGGSINMQGPYQVDARYDLDGTSGSIDIAKPIAIKARYSFGANGGSFVMQKPMPIDVSAFVSWEEVSFQMQRPMQVYTKATFSENEATLIMTNPYPIDIKATYSNNHVAFIASQPVSVILNAAADETGMLLKLSGPVEIDAVLTYDAFRLVTPYPVPINIEGSISSNQARFVISEPVQFIAEAGIESNGAHIKVSEPYPFIAELMVDTSSGSLVISDPYPVDIRYLYEGQSGSLEMTVPYEIKANYNFNDEAGAFNLLGPYVADASYSLGQNGGSFVMNNPFNVEVRFSIESSSGYINVDGPYEIKARYSFDSNGGVFTMEKPLQIDGRLTINENDGQLSVSGPLPVEASYSWDGETGAITVTRPIPVEASFKVTPSEGSFVMRQPTKIKAQYSYNGREGSFKMVTPVRINGQFTWDSNGGSVEVTTPYEVKASINLIENGVDFQMQKPISVSATGMFDGERASFEMSQPYAMSLQGSFDGQRASFTMQQPMRIDMEGFFDGRRGEFEMTEPTKIKVNGYMDDTRAEFNMIKPIKVVIDGELHSNSAKVTMRKPFDVTAEGRFDDNTVTISINGNRVSVDGSYDGQSVAFNMRQPLELSASMRFDGQQLSFETNKPYPISFDGSFDGRLASFNMYRPYEVTASAHLDETSASFNLNNPIAVSVNGVFDGEAAEFNMVAPYRMSARGSFNGEQATFSLDKPFPIAFEGEYRDNKLSLVLRQPYAMTIEALLEENRCSLSIDRPYPVSFEGTYTTNAVSFSMRQPYQVSLEATLDDTSASLSIDGPYKVSAQGSFDGTRASFEMQQPYPIYLHGHFDGSSASIDMAGGKYAVTAEGSFDGSRGHFAMQRPYIVSVGGHYNVDSASIDMDGPYRISADGILNERRAAFNMRSPYAVKAEGTLERDTLSFNMEQPYPFSVQGLYDGSRAVLNMEQPYQASFDGSIDALRGSLNVDIKPYPLSFKGSLEDGSLEFVMDSPLAVDIKGMLGSNAASLLMTRPYNVDARYTLGDGEASFTMQRPYEVDGSITYSSSDISIDMTKPASVKAQLALSGNGGIFNMQTPYQVDMSFTLSPRASSVSMRKPMPMDFEYNFNGWDLNNFDGFFMMNWNTRKENSAMELVVSHKDQSSNENVDRSGSIRMKLPTRTVGFSASIIRSDMQFTENVELMWDGDNNKYVSYLVDFKDKSGRYSTVYELSTNIYTPVRSMEAQFTHSSAVNDYSETYATLSWDSARDQSKKVAVSNTYTRSTTNREHSLIISSPLLDKNIEMINTITENDGTVFFAAKHSLTYHVDSRHNLLAEIKISDEGNTRYGNHNYTAYMAFSHEINTIDVSLTAHAGHTDRALSVGSVLNYMMAHGNYQTMLLWGNLNRVRNTMNIQMNTPYKTVSVQGAVKDSEVTFKAQDETREVNGVAQLNDDSFEIRAYVDPIDPTYLVTVTGEYRMGQELQLVASHGREGDMVNDVEVSLDLEDDHLVRSRFYVRPALISDVKRSLLNMRMDSSPVKQQVKLIGLDITSELFDKAAIMMNNLDVSPTSRFMSNEAVSWAEDYKVMKRGFNSMYWANEFYMKSLDKGMSAAFIATSDMVSMAARRINRELGNMFIYVVLPAVDYLEGCLNDCMEYLGDIYVIYEPVMMQGLNDMKNKMVTVGSAAASKLYAVGSETSSVSISVLKRAAVCGISALQYAYPASDFVAYVHSQAFMFYEELMEELPWQTIQAVLRGIENMYVKYQRFFVFIARQASQVDFLRPIYDARISLADVISDVISTMTSWNGQVSRLYESVLDNMHGAVGKAYRKWINSQEGVFVTEAIKELAETLHWSYTYMDIEGKLQTILESTLQLGVEVVRKNLDYLTEDWLRLDLDRIVTFAPRDGVFEFQFWMPTELPTLQTVPYTAVNWTDVYNRALIVLDNLLPDNLNPWDVYYQYKPSSDVRQWIPPFDAIATIAGQHITTFDGRTLEFKGTCTYVLARDVIDSSFTLLSDYDKQYLTLLSDNQRVQVSLTGHVMIDDEAVEAPYEYEDTQITRVGDMLKVEHARGFSLECDLQNEMCVFRMSGWYHGKVAGLMGTYTNEPSDDLTMSNGELADDVETLARSWEATGTCTQHQNLASEYPMVESRPSGRVCGALFMSKLSPMRNCFKVVDPRPYLRACIHDVEESADDRRGVCHIAAAYVARCHAKHVDVRPPRICMRSEETVSSPSADVVFVIEQKPCNEEIVSRLDNLAKQIDRALIDQGMTDNRFGVVGFGGVGVHNKAHAQTVSGQIFATSRDIATVESNMLFNEGGESSDALAAIDMTIGYPFRNGAARSVVLITCNACNEQSVSADDVRGRLATADIQLHMLVEHEFAMATSHNQPQTSYLFGVDSNSAFTKSDVGDRSLSGDASLYEQVVAPGDECARMALDSNGSFFDLAKLSSSRVRTQKSFMDVFSRRVAKTATAPRQVTSLLGNLGEEPEIFYQDKTFALDFETYMRS